ncbi:MAG: glycosyltransferase family 2 protein [Planctomycetes bacterium]|nr:glycosyltransferase family 2 protein [Planctomycetota bacterium]
MKTLDVILPVYNEEHGIVEFTSQLFSVLDELGGRFRCRAVFVVDRSADQSFSILKRLSDANPAITVIHLSRRFGHQMSLVAGIDYSRADAIIMMDCDLQHPPSVIKDLLVKFDEGYDVVQTIRVYDRQIPWLRRSLSTLFYKIQSLLSPINIPDGSADFLLITKKVASVFRDQVREHNQFLRGLFQWVGFNSTTIHFISSSRQFGVTKYQWRRLLSFAIVGVVSFSRFPLRVASIAGIVLSILSSLYGLFTIMGFLLGWKLPAGYPSLC